MDPTMAIQVVELIAKVIKTAVDLTPTVVKTVEDAKPFAQAIYSTLRGNQITKSQLEELERRIDELSAQLQLPLPPEED